MALCLEIEPPEKRVLAWLEHLNATQKEENEHDSLESSSDMYWENSSTAQSTSYRQEKNVSKNIKVRTKALVSPCGSQSSTIGRRTYSPEERNAIIKYITENDVFSFIKGNLLWKKMEVDKVCSRSWQSMRTQFLKKIYPNLAIYSVNENDKEKFIAYMKSSTPKKSVTLEPGQRGWRRNGNYYRLSEDKVIINYILQKHRYLRVLGNSLWKTMEEEKILPDRTWQSMRSRYLNFIFRDLEQYKLKESVVRKLRRVRRSDTSYKKEDEKSTKSAPLSLRTNDVNRDKKKNKQDLRRHAVNTGINLATKLGITKTKCVFKNENSSKNRSQSKERSVSGSQPFVKIDAAKKKIKQGSDISSQNFLKSAIPDSVSDPMNGSPTSGLRTLDTTINNYKNGTTNAGICTQEEDKHEKINKCEDSVFPILEQDNATNRKLDTTVVVNIDVLQKGKKNLVGQSNSDISCSHPQEIFNVDLEENCSDTKEKTVLENAEISQPVINVPCDNVNEFHNPQRASLSPDHSSHSEDTIILSRNVGSVQPVNKESEKKSLVLPQEIYLASYCNNVNSNTNYEEEMQNSTSTKNMPGNESHCKNSQHLVAAAEEEEGCSAAQSIAENDMQKNFKHNSHNVLENVISDTVENRVDVLEKTACGDRCVLDVCKNKFEKQNTFTVSRLRTLISVTGNCKQSPDTESLEDCIMQESEQSQICTQKESRYEMKNKYEGHVVEMEKRLSSDAEQFNADIGGCSCPQESSSPEKHCAEIEKTGIDCANTTKPENNVECDNVDKHHDNYNPQKSFVCKEHTFDSHGMTVSYININNAQEENESSVLQTNLSSKEEEEEEEDTFVYSEFSSSCIERNNCEKCFPHLNLSPSSN